MAQPYKYKGILAKRREPRISYSKDKVVDAAFDIIYSAATEALIDALFADCGARRDGPLNSELRRGLAAAAAPSNWQKVAITLAERHVPGFQHQVGKRRGRPPLFDEQKIVLRMMELTGQPTGQRKLSILSAARIVARERGKESETASIDRRFRRFLEAYEATTQSRQNSK
jgi:hypothetical protein